MHKTLISTDNVAFIRLNAEDPRWKSEELFKACSAGHKFTAGQECELVGLVDFPEFNGTRVTITSIREDGPNGKTYYIKGPIDKFVNWVYEYRLTTPAKNRRLEIICPLQKQSRSNSKTWMKPNFASSRNS